MSQKQCADPARHTPLSQQSLYPACWQESVHIRIQQLLTAAAVYESDSTILHCTSYCYRVYIHTKVKKLLWSCILCLKETSELNAVLRGESDHVYAAYFNLKTDGIQQLWLHYSINVLDIPATDAAGDVISSCDTANHTQKINPVNTNVEDYLVNTWNLSHQEPWHQGKCKKSHWSC